MGNVDVPQAPQFHYDNGRVGTVTGVRPDVPVRRARGARWAPVEFNEKPTVSEGFVSRRFFVSNGRSSITSNDDPGLMLEEDPLQKLARDGELAVFPHDGFWMGMDTWRDFTELDTLWQSGNAPWKVWAD